MKIALLFLILLTGLRSPAQEGLSIKYIAQNLYPTGKVDKQGDLIYDWVSSPDRYELNITGNLSVFKALPVNEKNRFHVSSFGGAVIAYTDVNMREVYIPVAPLTEKALMVRDSLNSLKWYFTRDIDTICGQSCRMAIAVNGSGYVYAWYAYELPPSFGPFNYTGLPGTVLLVEFSESNTRYIAIGMSDESQEVTIPETAFMSAEQYTALSREKRLYRAGLFGAKVDPLEVPRQSIILNRGVRRVSGVGF